MTRGNDEGRKNADGRNPKDERITLLKREAAEALGIRPSDFAMIQSHSFGSAKTYSV